MQRLRGANALLRRAVRQLGAPTPSVAVAAPSSTLAPLRGSRAPPAGASASALARRAFATSVVYPPCTAEIGKPAPDYSGTAVIDGEIRSVSMETTLKAGKWTVLVFYPKDFTFVCPTELIAFSDRSAEFEKLNTTVIAASTDTAESHLAWVRTPRKRGGLGHMKIPLLADVTKEISAQYGTLLKDAGIALRGLFVIDPSGVLQQVTINNLPVGRDVDEALRLVRAFQFVAEHGEVCPAGWQPGAATMVPTQDGAVSYFEAQPESAPDDDFSVNLPALRDEAALTAAIAGPGPVVVDWYAPWCGKCRQIAPHVDALQAAHPGVKFFKIDTDALPELAAKHGATVLPTFSFYKNGKPALPPLQGYKKAPLAEAVATLAK